VTGATASPTPGRRFFSRTGFALWIGATVGAVCALPYMNAAFPQALEAAARDSGLPPVALMALGVLQSAVLLGVMTFSGLWAATRLGLRAPVLDAWFGGDPVPFDLRRTAITAIALGAASGVLALALDLFVFLLLDPNGLGQIVQAKQPSAWRGFLASFSGGLAEEVELRLFLMSFLALGIRRARDLLFPARTEPLPPGVFWSANVLAAVIFGLGHLPATAVLVPLTPLLVVRAIVLNGSIGLLAGYFFWRRGIELAMLLHFAADIVLHVTPPLLGY